MALLIRKDVFGQKLKYVEPQPQKNYLFTILIKKFGDNSIKKKVICCREHKLIVLQSSFLLKPAFIENMPDKNKFKLFQF